MKIDFKDTKIPDEYIKLGKDLLKRLSREELTMEEFKKEVAYLALLSGFNELDPTPYPVRPTRLYEYDTLPADKQAKISGKLWSDPEICQYVSEKHKIWAENHGKRYW